jgi:hypothetical protein
MSPQGGTQIARQLIVLANRCAIFSLTACVIPDFPHYSGSACTI